MFIDFKTFGTFLAKKRLEAGLSQDALRRVLGYDSPQYVSNWERGLCAPPLKKLPVLTKALNIPIEDVIEMLTRETESYLRANLMGGTKRKGRTVKY